ncbi:MAG: hypothetical protein WDN66_01295 [Candidatus Saccharibacteria bacterium]
MTETLPHQQDPRQDTQNVDLLHDAIQNNEMGAPNWFNKKTGDPTPGRVDDIDKAHEMALAAKPGIDKVLGIVALRDHDLPGYDLMDISGSGHHLANGQGERLVTKPHRTELVDSRHRPTGKTGVRSETYRYSDLRESIQAANRSGVAAGKLYDLNKEKQVKRDL